MAVYKMTHEGKEYTWVEKGPRAFLKVGETTVLWWGEPTDPLSLRKLAAPLEVLLRFSLLRQTT